MVTRAEATQQGIKFAEKWDAEKHTVPEDAIKTFAQDLNSLNNLPAPQKNALKWAELRGATDGLISKKVLPNLDVADNKTNLRNCRIVGLTADGDKNPGNDDLVVAIGRRTDNPDKAQHIVILGQDGKFYQARPVQGGYVRSEKIAENAEELERKYNRPGFNPQSENDKTKVEPKSDEKPKPAVIAEDRGNPADLEEFRQGLKSFQSKSAPYEATAQKELNRLAQEYSRLSKDQQKIAFFDVLEGNKQLQQTWFSRELPRLAIQRGQDGRIRFSADWTSGSGYWPSEHHLYSQNFNI